MSVAAHRIIVNLTRFGDLLQTSPTIAALPRNASRGDDHAGRREELRRRRATAIPGIDRVDRAEPRSSRPPAAQGGTALLDAVPLRRATWSRELRAERVRPGAQLLELAHERRAARACCGVPDVRGWSMTRDGFRVIQPSVGAAVRDHVPEPPRRDLQPRRLLPRRSPAASTAPTRGLRYGRRPARTRASRRCSPAAGVAARRASGRAAARREQARSGNGRASPSPALARGSRRAGAASCWSAAAATVRSPSACVRRAVRRDAADRHLRADQRSAELGGAARALRRCCVSGDTGPMHMAVAVGTPVVGAVLRAGARRSTPGRTAPTTSCCTRRSPCAPCDHNVTCLDPFCRDELRPELVAAIVRARLAERLGRARRALAPRRRRRCGSTAPASTPGAVRLHARSAGRAARREDALRRRLPRDLAARCSRARRCRRPWRAGLDLAPFAALADLARSAPRHGRAARRRCAAPRARRSRRSSASAARSTRSTARIAEHGGVHPEVALLTQMFTFGKENLQGDDVATLAREIRALYRELARGGRLHDGAARRSRGRSTR